MADPEMMAIVRELGQVIGREIGASIAANMAAPAPGLLRPEELATALRASPKTIAKMAREGLPAHRVGGLVRYDLDEVKAWLRSRPPTDKAAEDAPPQRLGRGRRA